MSEDPVTAIDQVMRIMDRAFDPHWREAWNRAQIESSLALPHCYLLLADADGVAIDGDAGGVAAGFVLARRAPGEEELLLIAVDPDARKNGVGRALLEQFHRYARDNGAERVFLEMRENNPAERLYRDCGYEQIGLRKAYYRTLTGDRIDALTFGKTL